jgi:hypothetical protein
MDRTERFYKIEQLIRARGSVSFAELIATLEVSPATLKRDLQYLRDRMGAPIEYDASSNGNHEIERRWLTPFIPKEIGSISKLKFTDIVQTYISKKPVIRLRSHDKKEFIKISIVSKILATSPFTTMLSKAV